MSYARLGWLDSDVYVFTAASGHLECCGCAFVDRTSARFYSTDDMLEHLREHQAHGHHVPMVTFSELEADREEDDDFIRSKLGV